MSNFKAYTLDSQTNFVFEGNNQDCEQFVTSLVKQMSASVQGYANFAVLCDGQIAFTLRFYTAAGQQACTVRNVDAKTLKSEEERVNRAYALFSYAEECRMKGRYTLANRALNDAMAFVASPLSHPKARTLSSQATRLLAQGVDAVCKIQTPLAETLVSLEQLEVMADLARIEGDLLALHFKAKHDLFQGDTDSHVVLLATRVANLIIGTPYRHNRIASEILALGERLFGHVWTAALMYA